MNFTERLSAFGVASAFMSASKILLIHPPTTDSGNTSKY